MTAGKFRMHLTFKGQILFSFWVDSTSDKGLSIGPVIEGSDLHVTVFQRNGKMRYHIKHKGIQEPVDESPIGGQKSIKLIESELGRILKVKTRSYHGNKVCYVFPADRLRKFRSLSTVEATEDDVYLPLEVWMAEVETNFADRKSWERKRVRSLLEAEPRYGFARSKDGRVDMIVPISRTRLAALPVSRLETLFKYIMKVFGIDEFLDYFAKTDEGKKLISDAKDRIKALDK